MTRTPDLERLRELHAQAVGTVAQIEATVQKAREHGATWEEIGAALSMTKQGAQKRFGHDG